MTSDSLSVGVLVDGPLCRWQVDALEQMVEGGAEIDTVIVNEGRDPGIVHNLKRAKAYLLLAGCREIGARFFGTQPYFKKVPLSKVNCLVNANMIRCEPVSKEGLGQKLPADIVRNHCSSLDIVVRFGFGIIKGEILDAPTYGVFSYHHGDIHSYRGRPAGFWEFMEDAVAIGVTLQQLTEELDGGCVINIKEFDINETDTYQDVLETAYRGSIDMLAAAVRAIRAGEFNPKEPETLGDFYTAPGWRTVVEYVYKNTIRRLAKFQ